MTFQKKITAAVVVPPDGVRGNTGWTAKDSLCGASWGYVRSRRLCDPSRTAGKLPGKRGGYQCSNNRSLTACSNHWPPSKSADSCRLPAPGARSIDADFMFFPASTFVDMSLLEQSLDEIINSGPGGSRKSHSRPRQRAHRGVSKAHGKPSRGGRRPHRPSAPLPRSKEAEELSGGRPYLRVSHLHPELTEKDLEGLFSSIGDLLFTKIEYNTRGESTGVAFVGYQNPADCEVAIERFDGRRAAGQIISVENAIPLSQRISVSKRGKKARSRDREPKPRRKTVEELDAELNSYMGAPATEAPAAAEQPSETGEIGDSNPAFAATDMMVE
ncbi:hypothetical protein KL930_003448 [Ogataea haglerorum]|uniref:RRM domain-containing protein n=1 Tax=Ogataea haglerorum TaxID=1937702 RepID=A0AAN6D5U9_9ASCO|nr:uncharacterized protein KL911_003040 [Ogataea haglerorum]KAG7695780.1 hypothetical protein KL951_003305 [Ogataea haglerorum]KAG7727701.1 hypothetical protein KL933_002635 [Ogataea haglerorum]KAG7731024.1 hypothetical protein KL948_003304 [Ogataea haglerorum]KAG7752935.1 hypothetical protein KL911_003040 [Ogataea haglerorum]KAG7775248.1 hypothetical protein KL930_003448 [Ogataea haglerorum]